MLETRSPDRCLDVSHVPHGRVGRLLWPQPHWKVVEVVELSFVGQRVVSQAFFYYFQCFKVSGLVDLDVCFLPPEVGFQHAATPNADLQTTAAQVVQHADFLYEPHRMVERKDVNAGAEPQSRSAL